MSSEEETPPIPSTSQVTIKTSSRWSWLGKLSITVEPVLFAVFFGAAFTDIVITNSLETRICMMEFDLDKEHCSGSLNASTEKIVQPMVTKISMTKSMIECIVPAILSFFVGPWSDKNGRKPFILLPLAGIILFHLSWAFLILFIDHLSPWILLLPSIFLSLLGGGVSIFISVFSYIADITNEQNRSLRITIAQCSLMFGLLLGNLIVPKVYQGAGSNGDIMCFIIAGSVCFITFIHTSCFVPESVNRQGPRTQLFDLSFVKEMFATISKKRENYGRMVYFLLITIVCLVVVVFTGESGVRYLSLREKFSLTLPTYSLFLAISSSIAVVASLSGIWLFKTIFRAPDIYFLVVILLMNIASSLLMSFSETMIWFMIYANLSSFSIIIISVIRSEVSKTVAKTELGKAFGFLACLEALTPLPAAPAYMLLYNKVLATEPFLVYLLTMGIWITCLVLLAIIIILRNIKGEPYYKLLPSETFESENEGEDVSPISVN